MIFSVEEKKLKRTLPKTEVGRLFVARVKSSEGRLYFHDTLPRMRRTRQCYDLYFLSFRAKKGLKNHIFFEVVPGRTNPIFSPNQETMKREIAVWEEERNEQKATVNWRFTNQDARVKLERLYPQLDLS